ncbi:MAG: alpha/beta fold hydrolase [Eubacterium sp.]|nr:alpha/beta fold hydrolase [Eubacterium sp.]
MINNFYYPSSDKETTIHAMEWIPEGDVRAILQISHGMVEHISRYERFASYLNQYGIYVVGNDHLGHGESVTGDDKHGYFHHPDGNQCVIADIHKLRRITAEKYPDRPYFVLGHSMGSFLIRQYLMMHGEGLAGAIIMGTGSQPGPVLMAGKSLCKFLSLFHGWNYRSSLANSMAFSSNNKRFEPARTPYDWLTRDESIVDIYMKDPWCTFVFTLNGFYEMFKGIQFIQSKSNIDKIPKDCPLLIVSGRDDPVGNYGKGVRKVVHDYRKAGIRDIRMRLYKDDRHEILNELDYEKVYRDIRVWLLHYAN